MSSIQELPQERLASMDSEGHRVFLHPADVEGKYHRLRVLTHAFLIVLFLLLPWIKINGYQSILLNIAQRKFTIFGLAFWAHDAPMLIFVFGGVFVGILLTTAILGLIFIIGPQKAFYQLHEWAFTENAQWFFYYQDSLMTTLMSEIVFADIAVLLGTVSFAIWFFITLVLRRYLI